MRPWQIDVSSPRGAIEITVDKDAKAPRILASSPENPEALDPAKWVAAVAVVGEEGNSLQVTASDAREGESRVVDLSIVLPASFGVKVRAGTGPVIVRGVGGGLDIVSGQELGAGGPVYVQTGQALRSGLVVRSSRGRVYVRAGKETQGRVHVHGSEGSTVLAPRGQHGTIVQDGTGMRGTLGPDSPESPVISIIAEQGLAELRLDR
jgi:hypothetical protein